jgi:hypothetical protein
MVSHVCWAIKLVLSKQAKKGMARRAQCRVHVATQSPADVEISA